MTIKPGLRERKKERTKKALVDAALDLFSRKGYDETTVADLAEAADISPRTFFSHFASKEDVLFADPPLRLAGFDEVLTHPLPGEPPAQLLLRAFRSVLERDGVLMGEAERVRAGLILRTPALQVGALRKLLEGQRTLTQVLLATYPDDLDPVTAAALVGAYVGAFVGAITTLYSDPAINAKLAAEPSAMRERLLGALLDVCENLSRDAVRPG